jgi:diguanylate cyclase (GGDEF)-like protein
MKISLQINLLLFTLFCGVIIAGYTSIHQLEIFHNEALSINNLGVIRGTIQRITKLELSNINSTTLIQETDALITSEKELYQNNNLDISKAELKNISNQFTRLEMAWNDLKILYQHHRNDKKRLQQIIDKSEACWNEANNIVYSAQKVSETKHLFYKNRTIFTLITVSIFILGIIYLVYKIVHKNLEIGIITDPMTKLFNRNYFDHILQKQLKLKTRYGVPFSLILCDVDFFKNINDKFGHQQGDRVLIQLANIFQNNARENDYVFRIGGEEFALIFTQTNQAQALVIAEKFRHLVSEVNFSLNQSITISIGVSECSIEEGAESLFRRTDSALYQAKSLGRNKVVSEAYQHSINFSQANL